MSEALEGKIFAALSIWIQRMVRVIIEKGASHPIVSKLLTDMNDEVAQMVYEFFPLVAGLGINKIQDDLFKTPERGRMLREALTEAVKIGLDEVKKRNDPNYVPADPDELGKKAVEAAKERVLVVDRLGYGHMPDCIEMMRLFKKGERLEVKLGDFIAQGKTGAPCCFKRIAVEAAKPVEKQAEKANKTNAKKRESFADLTNQLSPEELNELNLMLTTMTPEQEERFMGYAVEFDSVGELRGFLKINPDVRLRYLEAVKEKDVNTKKIMSSLLEALGNGATELKNGVVNIGSGIKAGATNLLRTVKELDDSLAPLAADLAARANRPPKKVGKLDGLKKWFMPF